METNIQHQEPFQYAEVYISDMFALKNIFQQIQNTRKINPEFGIPFLLVRKKNEVIGFASLVVQEKNGIAFKIFEQKAMPETERKNFVSRAENYIKASTAPNFRNPEQLKSSVQKMISWLNM
ncbi:hypothetical protein [Chryseobacterium sp. BIGb0232]|uniref:hypothetical protein n=1 Tax=Chryseobacterium sp. BIGb0232 TaxID=2940598 RepID=UPI000F4AAF31|nr:hypothetical protein [Chryseobacterium sp. BIGb0232]MCS4304281.1 nucleoid DNA-binding protein [Chryseobacterium sp. BIGb0232]ROS14166.1 hypothetical protein EDF65_2932 [Chryseobacterium nakagawai]